MDISSLNPVLSQIVSPSIMTVLLGIVAWVVICILSELSIQGLLAFKLSIEMSDVILMDLPL